uniref:Uncharacterized protein n=1 Tax=Romanomermis culicivorax TaxID=13658 RepID=A0A915JUQ0_ROMCU
MEIIKKVSQSRITTVVKTKANPYKMRRRVKMPVVTQQTSPHQGFDLGLKATSFLQIHQITQIEPYLNWAWLTYLTDIEEYKRQGFIYHGCRITINLARYRYI